MKRVLFSLVFVALSAMTFAQQWTSLGKSTPSKPEVKLVSSSERAANSKSLSTSHWEVFL